MLILSTNVDQNSLEAGFSIVIVARLATIGNRKHCSSDFDPLSSIVKSVFDRRLSGAYSVIMVFHLIVSELLLIILVSLCSLSNWYHLIPTVL